MIENVLVYGVPATLAAVATLDCVRTPAVSVRQLPKPLWVPVILGLFLIGPVCWLAAGRPRRPPRVTEPAAPPPLPPDDDPEILRLIAEQINRRRAGQ